MTCFNTVGVSPDIRNSVRISFLCLITHYTELTPMYFVNIFHILNELILSGRSIHRCLLVFLTVSSVLVVSHRSIPMLNIFDVFQTFCTIQKFVKEVYRYHQIYFISCSEVSWNRQ